MQLIIYYYNVFCANEGGDLKNLVPPTHTSD